MQEIPIKTKSFQGDRKKYSLKNRKIKPKLKAFSKLAKAENTINNIAVKLSKMKVRKAINMDKVSPTDRSKRLSKEIILQKQAAMMYIEAVLFPEFAPVGAQCPATAIVPPTSAFKTQLVTTVSANATGFLFLAFIRAPMIWSTSATSQFYVNNAALLNGIGGGGSGSTLTAGLNFVSPTVTVGAQTFAAYQRYRPVAMSLTIEYVGSVLNQAGFFTSCYSFDALTGSLNIGTTNALLDRYLTFANLRMGTWSKKHQAGKGVRMLYIPLDPSFFTFTTLDQSVNSAINMLIGAQGFPANAPFEVTATYHWEALPDILANNTFMVKPNITKISNTQQETLLKIMPQVADTDAAAIEPNNGSLFDKIIKWTADNGPTITSAIKGFLSAF